MATTKTAHGDNATGALVFADSSEQIENGFLKESRRILRTYETQAACNRPLKLMEHNAFVAASETTEDAYIDFCADGASRAIHQQEIRTSEMRRQEVDWIAGNRSWHHSMVV